MSYSETTSFDQSLELWKTGIEGVKKDKKCKILCELRSVKNSPLTKVNILEHENWVKKYIKTDFF